MLIIELQRLSFGSGHMQKSNAPLLIGLEALREAVEINIVTEKMARIRRNNQGNLVLLSLYISTLLLLKLPFWKFRPTYRKVLVPPLVHISYIQVCRQLAGHVGPWPVRACWILWGNRAVQVPYLVVVPMAQLLERVLGLGRRHSYVQHKINSRYAAELGLP